MYKKDDKEDIESCLQKMMLSRTQYYKRKGGKWFLISIVICVIILTLITGIFVFLNPMRIAENRVLCIVLSLVIITLGVFYLNLCIKMIISSYHLTREYREKRLALEAAFGPLGPVDDNLRKLILKKLFLNIDVGILRNTDCNYIKAKDIFPIGK